MNSLKTRVLKRAKQGGVFSHELMFAAAILICYLIVLIVATALTDSSTQLTTTLYPNLWLLGMTVYFKRRQLVELFALKKISGGLVAYASIVCLAVGLFCFYSQTNHPIQHHISVQAEQLLTALFIVILVPIAEELFFRGYLLQLFSVYFNKVYSVILVSILFSFLHIRAGLSFEMFCLSSLLCLLVLYFNNLVPALITHISWNAVSQINAILSLPVRWFVMVAALTGIIATIPVGAKLYEQLSDQ